MKSLVRPASGRLAAAIALALVLGSLASAETTQPTACGSVVHGEVRLEADLVGCGRTGLTLASDAVLDCAGHEIRGQGPGESLYGIQIDRAERAQVKNCRIGGFRRGMRIRGGSGNRILGNRLEGNVYGVDVAGATEAGTSQEHLIAGNHITGSVMDGIHLGTGTAKTVLTDNVIRDSGQEGLYFQWCEECSALGNIVEGSGEAAVYIKHSSRGTFADNSVRGSMIHVRGESAYNVFARNELIGSSFVATVRRRLTPALYGVGLVDSVSEEAILANADPDDANGDGISGRANRVDGGLGRFGWKAQEDSLRSFAARAMLEEIGITSPLFPEETGMPTRGRDCDAAADPEDDGSELAALEDFVRLLAPLPAVGSGAATERRGEEIFRAGGCPSCHVEELPVGERAAGSIRLFSDLLLHDMGTSLADGVEQGDATGSEFRTAPLWGAVQRRAYLHDGRAPNLNAAIALHDGEARVARDRFLALERADRDALIAYLGTL